MAKFLTKALGALASSIPKDKYFHFGYRCAVRHHRMGIAGHTTSHYSQRIAIMM
jgi:hypothetical protein